MHEPIILHDRIMGGVPPMRALVLAAEAGRLDPSDPDVQHNFYVDGVGFVQSMYLLWRMLCEYRRFGQQVFVVGPTLSEMFQNTSLRGAPGDMVRFPYDAFYIALPDSGMRLWGGNNTGWHEMAGILVSKSNDRVFRLYLWGAENEYSVTVGDDASFWLELDLETIQRDGVDLEQYAENLLNDPRRDWSVYVKDAPDSDPVLASGLTRTNSHPPVPLDAVRTEVKRVAIASIRIVLNLAIYLQSQAAERTSHPAFDRVRAERKRIEDEAKRKKNPAKRKRLLRELERLSDAHVTWLGKTIEETVEAQEAAYRNSGGGPRVRFWVRGHWWPRLDNLAARARHGGIRWVQPYLKNRDADEAEPSRHYKFAGQEGEKARAEDGGKVEETVPVSEAKAKGSLP